MHAHTHRHRDEVTERLAERPRLQQAGYRRERDRQQAHDDVGYGQVGDEDVCNGLHGAPGGHNVDHIRDHQDHLIGDHPRCRPRCCCQLRRAQR